MFLGVSQAFDKVWTPGLLHKVSHYLPQQYVEILASYLDKRKFKIHYGEAISGTRKIATGVPQGSVLGPLLYILFIADIPTDPHIVTAMFADDTALTAVSSSYEEANNSLQAHVDTVYSWTKDWKIKLNSEKSVQVDFALRPHKTLPIDIDGSQINVKDSAKYLGVHLDKKVTWKKHFMTKKEELKLRLQYWMKRPKSKILLGNKRLLYTTILRPVWAYAAQIWACTADKNLQIIQRVQNKILHTISGASWYMTNHQIHSDLQTLYVKEVVRRMAAA